MWQYSLLVIVGCSFAMVLQLDKSLEQLTAGVTSFAFCISLLFSEAGVDHLALTCACQSYVMSGDYVHASAVKLTSELNSNVPKMK